MVRNRPPLVAHCLGTLRLAGTEKEVLSFLRHGDPKRFRNLVCVPRGGEGPLRRMLDEMGAELVDLPHGIFARASIFRKHHVDLVHVLASRRDALAGRLAGCTVVQKRNLPIRGYASQYVRKPLTDRLLTRFLCHGTVTVAQALKTDLMNHGGFDPQRIAVVPNGIEIELYQPTNEETNAIRKRHDLPEPGSTPIIGTVARLHPQKGLQHLLAAIPRVIERNPNILFVIAGEGEEEGRLKQLADDLGLTHKNLRFLGFEADVPALLSTFDLFVLSSLWEGMPFAILEAMAAGKAQVVTDVDGCRELVVEGETGLLVVQEQPDLLADGIIKLLANTDLRLKMGDAAHQRAEEAFSPKRSAMLLENVFAALLAGKPAASAGWDASTDTR